MSKTFVAMLLLLSTFASAASNPNPAEYSVNVHVSSSRMIREGGSMAFTQLLVVTIDGKKYELESGYPANALLALGDYKAKLVKDEHRGDHDTYRVYEFLFSDNRTRRFIVVGQTE